MKAGRPVGLLSYRSKTSITSPVFFRHRGADPFSPVVAMAHLGIARAHARAGARAESRVAYEALLDLWKNADPDLPVLAKAKQELAALNR